MANTIQSGILCNRKSYEQFGYFLGGIDVTNQNLDEFTPYIQGVSRIFLYNPPFFMDKQYPRETRNFKTLIESGYTSIQGIGDITVDFVEFEGGFNGDKFSNVSHAKDETDTLTISVYEQSGSPAREYLDTWVTGVRDIRSGIAHYHGAIEEQPTVKAYGQKYHTAEFIYETMDPTAKYIEYACMFANGFPAKVPKSHLNYEKGNRENVSMELEFRIKKYESPAINEVATNYLEESSIEYNYLKFTPNISKADVKARAIKYNNGNKWNG